MNINTLPNDCLFLLFNRYFTLQEQLCTIRPVCARWNVLISEFCAQKRSLKIIGATGSELEKLKRRSTLRVKDDEGFYQINLETIQNDNNNEMVVHLARFDDDFCMFLVEQFSNIEQLVLWFKDCTMTIEYPYTKVEYLLDQWSATLTSLSLKGLATCTDVHLRTSLLHKINTLPSLRHLDLFLKNFFYFVEATDQDDLYDDRYIFAQINLLEHIKPQVLNRLESFSLGYYNADSIEQILDQLGPKCTKLSLKSNTNFKSKDFQKFLPKNPFIKLNISELFLSDYEFCKVESIALICRDFKNLQVLHLQWLETLEYSVFDSIAQLEKLRKLELSFYPPENKLPEKPLPKLSRVKTVFLRLLGGSQNDNPYFEEVVTFVPALPTLFPNVTELNFEARHKDSLKMFKEFVFGGNNFLSLKKFRFFAAKDGDYIDENF